MKAAVLTSPQEISKQPLRIEEVPKPKPEPSQVLLRVRACGVCRTDLHIVEGELPVQCQRVIPGRRPIAIVRLLKNNSVRVLEASYILIADGRCGLLASRPRPSGDLGVKAHFENIARPIIDDTACIAT